jgi:hypothetical protein
MHFLLASIHTNASKNAACLLLAYSDVDLTLEQHPGLHRAQEHCHMLFSPEI